MVSNTYTYMQRHQNINRTYFTFRRREVLYTTAQVTNLEKDPFLTFPADFLVPIIFSSLNYNCSDILDLKNFQEQVKKAFRLKNWSDLSLFQDWLEFQKFFSITRTIFLTVGQNNFGNKIPFIENGDRYFYTGVLLCVIFVQILYWNGETFWKSLTCTYIYIFHLWNRSLDSVVCFSLLFFT